MSVFNAMRGAALGLACLVTVAGCTNAPDRQVTAGTIGKSIKETVLSPEAPEAPDARQVAADIAKALEATDAPLILLTVPKRKQVTVMQKLEENRGYETYGTADRRSIVLRGGMLTGTRGLGHDVMSSDVAEVRALVSNRRSGTARRVMRYLDGEDLTVARVWQCDVRVGDIGRVTLAQRKADVTEVTETCAGDGPDFTNTYQVGAEGRILASRQWHSPPVGYLSIRTLR